MMSNPKLRWIIYGANGYTGRLIAQEAKRRDMSPILAGRSDSVKGLAKELGLEARVFPLDGPVQEVARNLDGAFLVLHTAGPFSTTSAPMVEACLLSKTHYLDITGEIEVFERIHARTEEFKRTGLVALPGVGFDVVPTDCLAAMLKEKLPDAVRLVMAFKADGGPSPGTAKTALEGLKNGGRVRRAGKIVRVPVAAKSRKVPFGSGAAHAVLTPWGDVSTAFYSTGIPDIEFYVAAPKNAPFVMRAVSKLLHLPGFESLAKKMIEKNIPGPKQKTRDSGLTWIWGEVQNDEGKTVSLGMRVPEGYRFTTLAALASVERVLEGNQQVSSGALTPSLAFGKDFVLALEGVEVLGA